MSWQLPLTVRDAGDGPVPAALLPLSTRAGTGNFDVRPTTVIGADVDLLVPDTTENVVVSLAHPRFAPLVVMLVCGPGETSWRWTEDALWVTTQGRRVTVGAVLSRMRLAPLTSAGEADLMRRAEQVKARVDAAARRRLPVPFGVRIDGLPGMLRDREFHRNSGAQDELQPTIIADEAVSDRGVDIGKHFPIVIPGRRPYYLITEETWPAPRGSSLGWLVQLDGDMHRNAFLNSPWVKAVPPIRPGSEREALAWLRRPEVVGTDGLDEPYPFDPAADPPEYQNLTIEQVLLTIADDIAAEHKTSLTPVPVDKSAVNPQLALPAETVFANGFDPLEGGIAFGADAFKVFSQWIEMLPTDQVVATEYDLKGL